MSHKPKPNMARKPKGRNANEETTSMPKRSRQAQRDAATPSANSSLMEVDEPVAPQNVDEFDDLHVSEDEEGGKRVCGIYIPPPVPAYCSAASKGPRLIIKKIVNYNFKSYAGVEELGPFHHCFTAIIGPNGSGKSNVIDSMLFVFGYRANKIRCKKVSTLIHNSNRHQNVRECYVAIHFVQIEDLENGGCVEVPNSGFVVKRNAFADNSSSYFIDGRRVKFNDVSKLLKNHNVDLDHNRFLILQGEVESIAMMKPKAQNENDTGMLEYLEDIIGTNRYIKPLEQLNEMVNKLNIERGEKFNRFRLAETEVNDLKGPYDAACQYLKEENKKTHNLNKMFQKYILDVKNKLADVNENHQEADKKLKDHDAEAESLSKERKEKEDLVSRETKEFDNLCKKKSALEKELEKCTGSFNEVQSTMESKNKQRKKNKTTVEKQEKELVDLRKVPEKNLQEMEECAKKIEMLKKQRAENESELEKNYVIFKESTAPLIAERDSLETELIALQKDVDEAKADLALSESELKLLMSEEMTEVRKYQTLKSGYETTVQNFEELKQKQIELKQKIPELKNEIAKKTSLLKQKQNEDEAMQGQLRKIQSEIKEKATVEESRHSNNKVLNFLMRQKDEGRITGILGRLGDLGGIDAKYDVAISTACGRLDNIVVETVQAAQDCIEALKKYDAGRATFIALEKVSRLENSMGRIQTPENVPRLFDLVRVEDQRVLPAFYFALGNTLVATDLEQGSRVAYGARRFRVVTLKGELIETSGTMSGGGRSQFRGKMGTQVQTKTKASSLDDSLLTQKALDDMKAKAMDLQNKISFCQEEQGRLEQELRKLKITLQQSEKELEQASSSVKGFEGHLPALLKQLKLQEERMNKTKSDSGKVKSVEALIEQKKETLKQRENEAEVVVKKVDDIKDRIDKIHGEKVKGLQTKIADIDKQIKKLDANVSKLKVNNTTTERNIQKLEKSIENLKTEIEELEKTIVQLNEDRTKWDGEAEKLSKEVEEAKAAIATAQKASSSVMKEIAAIQKKEDELKLQRVEIEKAVQDLAVKVKELQATIPYWQAKIEPLCLNEIPNEQVEPLKTYTDEELEAMNLDDLQYRNTALEEKLKKKPNLSIIQEYQEKVKMLYERQETYMQVVDKLKDMRDTYDEVRKNRYKEFTTGFGIISNKLKEMYQMITQGGDAELEMVDSMDPFTEGINFSVRPPRKSWKIITNLSGGEKTLSSLALVFALHYYKPSPLYFMDEIDAALDFKNISIVAHYIKERTKNAQFIIISLRNNMFELSDYLVGIYKTQDCTSSMTVENEYVPYNMQMPRGKENQAQVTNTSIHDIDMSEHERSQELSEFTSLNALPNAHAVAEKRRLTTVHSTAAEPSEKSNVQAPIAAAVQQESAPLRPSQFDYAPGRETTFLPSSESTALSQNIAGSMHRDSSLQTAGNTSAAGEAPVSNDGFKRPATPRRRNANLDASRMEE